MTSSGDTSAWAPPPVVARGGRVFIDGKALPETYLAPGTQTDCANSQAQCFPTGSLPPGEYFIMGDKRAASKDSRFYGAVKGTSVVAVAIRILSPPSRAGSVPGSSW